MKIPVVFLLFLGVALARGDATPDKGNQLETKNVPQVIKPSTMETASTRTGDLQLGRMQYQTNRMDIQDYQKQQQQQSHIQSEASQFYNNQEFQNPPVRGLDPTVQQPQLFHRQNQAPFQSRAQFHHSQQGGQTDPEVSGFSQSQQRMLTPSGASFQSHQSKEQGQDFPGQQQLYPGGGVHSQQEFHQDRMRNVGDQTLEEKRFADATDVSEFHSSEMRTGGGFPPIFHQRSAFDNRGHPIVLPGISKTHSTSVVVSGLKNLPVLPALVYNAGAVPTTVAYSRPVFQGAAFIKQHWQTPYARYVYSHTL